MKHFARHRASDLRILYYFECKKIMSRKMVRITIGVMLLLILVANVSSLFIKSVSMNENGETIYKSGYEEVMETKDASKELSGRAINEDLLAEMRKAYGDMRIVFYEKEVEETGISTNTSVAVETVKMRKMEEVRQRF